MGLTQRQDQGFWGWHPLRELEEMSNRMNRVLTGRWPGVHEREAFTMADWTPPVNISEADKEYLIQVELPEVERKDVHVTLDRGILTIEGERHRHKEAKGERQHRVECSYGHFIRTFNVPTDANEASITATFKDGMLNVRVPRSATKKAKEIAVD